LRSLDAPRSVERRHCY